MADTDVTVARLRNNVLRDIIIVQRHAFENGNQRMLVPDSPTRLDKTMALLDILIQYHRSVGAVEALAAVLTAFQKQDEPNTYEWAIIRKALAAAQARLAAYEEE